MDYRSAILKLITEYIDEADNQCRPGLPPRYTRYPLHGIAVTEQPQNPHTAPHRLCKIMLHISPWLQNIHYTVSLSLHNHRTHTLHLTDCARSCYTSAPGYKISTSRYRCHYTTTELAHCTSLIVQDHDIYQPPITRYPLHGITVIEQPQNPHTAPH
ncbi:hypothetical protein J6590_080828 [Homalodisca vitripennis]|nr:hypothetical protein J6590_080828 [Homalodisca vitripennis]